MKKEMNKPVHKAFWIESDDLEAVKIIAEIEGRSVAAVIRSAIKEYIEMRG